jgi:hypothetical protein
MGEMVSLYIKKSDVNRDNSDSRMHRTNHSRSMNTSIDRILFFQRTVGNQAVQRLLRSGALQAKLRIGQTGDVYEQEADRVTDEVMRMPEPQAVSQENPYIQRVCLGCEEEELKHQPIEEEEEEELLQTKEISGQNAETTPDLESRINAIRGNGRFLAESERAFFEPRFEYDFSQVRVHSDSRAANVSEVLNARSDQGDIAYEVVLNNSLIQKEEGEPEEEEGAEIRQEQQEINIALYDQNPAHMHPDHRLHTELRAFHGWAIDWAQDYSASSHAVRIHSDIHDALTGVIAQLPPGGRIGTIACFGHGSSWSGWVGMGDIGNILLAPGIRNRLSSNLRVILYMCSAGASPRSTRTIEPGGEEPARGPGGVRSFAAGLRDRLAGAQLRNVEVWAHTIRGVAATSPHWRVFADEGTPGEAFFRTVFDEIEVPIDFGQLSMRYRRLDEASRQTRSKEFPTSSADLCDRWMWRFYLNFVSGEEIATRIPMEPDQCQEEIWRNWRAYRDGDSSVLRPGRIWYDFLNTNDFEDLPHLR